MKILIAYFYEFQSKFDGFDVQVLKRGTSYFNVTIERKSDKAIISIRDVLKYTSPCNLDSFLHQWGASFTKSIFPHGYFDSIESMRNCVAFPPREAFFNTLKQIPVDEDQYQTAKNLYESKRMPNMSHWLEYYNSLDVEPLVEALNNSFKKFHELFEIDPNMELSLPTVAFKAMFRLFDPSLPYCYTFDNQRSHIREQHRLNILGGLSSVYHRHIDLSGNTTGPINSRIAPNGDPYSHVLFVDFTRYALNKSNVHQYIFSMYLYSQEQFLPCGPGIEWTCHKNQFKKSVMISQVSFVQMQWLFAMQETDICRDKNDNRIQIAHAYHQNEVVMNGHKPDGYAKVDGKHIFFEFLGM